MLDAIGAKRSRATWARAVEKRKKRGPTKNGYLSATAGAHRFAKRKQTIVVFAMRLFHPRSVSAELDSRSASGLTARIETWDENRSRTLREVWVDMLLH